MSIAGAPPPETVAPPPGTPPLLDENGNPILVIGGGGPAKPGKPGKPDPEEEPKGEGPTKVDGPIRAPDEDPDEAVGPDPSPSDPDPDPVVGLEPDPEPGPVRVDGPVPAPEPQPATPPPVDVAGPAPIDPTEVETPAPVEPEVAETPVEPEIAAPVEPVEPKPNKAARAKAKAEEEARRQAARLIRQMLAPPQAVAVEPEPGAAPAAAREPASAAAAPRIALSSGDGAETYRQFEISALGLTPRARQVVGALGFRILSERRSVLLGNRVVAKLRTPRNQTAEAALTRVRALLPDVTFDFAHLYRPSGDQPAPVRYPVDMVGAPDQGGCRIDARIGLIDTGVGEHPSLDAAAITRRSFVDKDAARNVAHGTAIASILVGELPGTAPLAPGAAIYAANVFVQDGKNLRADALAIIEALDWMAAQRVPVVNLSLMGPSNALLEVAVRAAAERGQILVAAAGNDGPDAEPAYPAAYAGVIAVAAVDQRGRPYGRGNRGAYVYVAAPGVDVWGADARGGEAFWTGTSFAAPFVTATVARDLAQGRARDINDGRARIAASARDLGAPGRDPIYGHGLLQVGGCSGSGAGSAAMSSKN